MVTLLIAVHHAIAYIHGGAHTDLAIVMSVFQNAFIYFVILLVPLAGELNLSTQILPLNARSADQPQGIGMRR
ncbi:MAG: hypothetical protein VX929_05620 [Pseudomonadota bacterium]|nr:hypothetical protein [Pseudomonadota bacterium]